MKSNVESINIWVERIVLALIVLAIGSVIMVLFNPWRNPRLDRIDDYLAKISTGILLLVLALFARKSKHFGKYWLIPFAFFILTVAISLDFIFGQYLIKYLGVSDSTPAGWALPKLNEMFVVVSVIVAFTLLSGGDLGSVFLQKGNLELGLSLGMIAFSIFVISAIPMASLFQGQNLSLTKIIPWIPWILIFVLANAAMEELLFRGLFLRKLEPFFGKFFSNFLIAVIFVGIHLSGSLTGDERLFVAFLFPLALVLGYIMQKTDSLWGSLLFHAGMDIPVILGIFSNL
ncbi:MAG: CPBP family intramembrane glutamic endopeptidase [Anaerolineales bacterium]